MVLSFLVNASVDELELPLVHVKHKVLRLHQLLDYWHWTVLVAVLHELKGSLESLFIHIDNVDFVTVVAVLDYAFY